jgi:transcriptional regulator with XRE-family HTH domain
MRYKATPVPYGARLRDARRARGLSQAALARRAGLGRVTVARLEAGGLRDLRVSTLRRLCSALALELSVEAPGALRVLETRLLRERDAARRLDLRLRHAALAARLLTLPQARALALVEAARARVDLWARGGLCSTHYRGRWRERLRGSPRDVARALLAPDPWQDALFQNTPFAAALEPLARAA